jgi:Flp pilus assembly pilin Flp
MQFKKDHKGQTAVETMLMIAAAVVIAVAVGLYLKSIPPTIENTITHQREDILNTF